MRKIGSKNKFLMIVLAALTFFIMLLFFSAIKFVSKLDFSTYTIEKDNSLYDKNYNLIKLNNKGKLKKSVNGNYYLTITEDKMKKSYNLGKHAIVYNPNLKELQLYGEYFEVEASGDVVKHRKQTEFTVGEKSVFLKLQDRKYLWIDKKLQSSGVINTNNFLIIELDKIGNASFYNNEIKIKTINPFVLTGSEYDFDIVNERLLISSTGINLKNIIGSTNKYKQPKEKKEKAEVDSSNDNYYQQYFKKVVNSFNNLHGNVGNINEQTKLNNQKTDVRIDLTKWLSLNSVSTYPSAIKITYNVFDPNKEYNSVFVKVKESEAEVYDKQFVSKEKNEYLIRNLEPNKSYDIEFGYTDYISNSEVIIDNVIAQTNNPKYKLDITRVTRDKLYFKLKSDSNFVIDSGNVSLFVDGEEIDLRPINVNKIKDGYTDSFDYTMNGYYIEVRITDLMYNGEAINIRAHSKIINE